MKVWVVCRGAHGASEVYVYQTKPPAVQRALKMLRAFQKHIGVPGPERISQEATLKAYGLACAYHEGCRVDIQVQEQEVGP